MRIIAGRWGGHTIRAPRGRRTRPTSDRVREAWMSMLQPALADARILDLFAGSGALGLETLSRGAGHATFVERSRSALKVLRANIETLGAEAQTTVVRGDALAYVEGLEAHAFDVAVADPPYGRGYAEGLARTFERTPFAEWLSVEHRTTDPMPELPGAETRSYGDTTLTTIPAGR